jgi:hypothetical protein
VTIGWAIFEDLSGVQILYTVLCLALVGVAVVRSWRSATNVIAKNRGWTRAWRIGVSISALSIGGWSLPLGAIYAISTYKVPARARSATS